MKTWLITIKNKIIEIIQIIKTKLITSIIRISFVGYSDYDNIELLSKTVKIQFNSNLLEIIEIINKILSNTQFNGDDVPEDVISGFEFVLKMDWKANTRILIHIGYFYINLYIYNTFYY